jgi:hypothetical protein
MKAKLLVLSAILLSGALLFGQGGYKGSISADITTEDGSPLPGAVAELTADTFSRSFVSDANGSVRFLGLTPSTYELRVTFTGFNTLVRPNLIVDAGQAVNLNIVMTPSTQQEELVVTAESPLLDSQKTGTQTVINESELNAIPQSRDPWSVIATVPGVQTDRINVGGSEAGQQSRFSSKGDTGANASWVMDGIEFVDPAARGATQSYLDFSSFAQVGVTTGGADVSQRSGGAALNFVTKQGSNNHQGSVRLLYADEEFQASNDGVFFNDGTPARGTGIAETFEKTFELGGPLVKDRLWYWGSFSQNSITQLTINGQEDETELRNISLKVHGDLSSTTRFNVFFTEGDKVKNGRGAGVTRPRNTTWDQEGPTPIYKFEISQLIGQNTELAFLAARVDGKFSLTPIGSEGQIGFDYATNIWEDTTYFDYSTVRPVRQYEIKGNTFLSSSGLDHELTYGFQYKEASVTSQTTYGDDSLVRYLNPPWFPEGTQAAVLYREGLVSTDLEYIAFTAQDTATYGNWTFKWGLRYDSQEGNNVGVTLRENAFQPEGLLPGLTSQDQPVPFTWETIAPRLGLTYSWGSDNQFLVRFSASQFYDTLGSGFISPSIATNARYTYHYWYDGQGEGAIADNIVQAGELSEVITQDVGALNDAIDPDLDPPRTDEFIAGFEWAISPEFTIGISSTIRERSDTIWNPFADFMTADSFVGETRTLFGDRNAITNQNVTLTTFQVDPDVAATIPDRNGDGMVDNQDLQNITSNRPNYTEDYFDIELTATKRLSNRWMLRANLNFIDWSRNLGDNSVADPTDFQSGSNEDGAFVGVQSSGSGNRANVFFGSASYSGSVNALVQLPLDINISTNIQVREGFAYPYAVRYRISDIRGNNNVNVKIDDFDNFRGDDIVVADFKVSKTFHLAGRTKVEIAAELFNSFNESTVLARELRIFEQDVNDPTNLTNEPREVLSPRVGRFSATVHF